jgi:hypothetical protein
MACCVLGATVIAVVLWAVRLVKRRVLGRSEAPEPAAWRLHPWTADDVQEEPQQVVKVRAIGIKDRNDVRIGGEVIEL